MIDRMFPGNCGFLYFCNGIYHLYDMRSRSFKKSTLGFDMDFTYDTSEEEILKRVWKISVKKGMAIDLSQNDSSQWVILRNEEML